ncbi:HIT family protein [Paenibacillus sp. 7124]|uniref:HIT family protein n=1 Tax=Paenibacillus apii TaxID=1850370 RepID=A0A6M1PUM7_9BACL|nr:HIT family protein [Paenibacillus apii]NGM85645.1 HIT family protein [Paenibacillus apii]NJJ40437.1 HIT family protein [Paenibacillus apii]
MPNKADNGSIDDPECFYCSKNHKLERLMIKAAKLRVSTLYLNKDQTHQGRCIVAYNRHVRELFHLDPTDLQLFMEDVSQAARTLHEAFQPDKMNYGIYGDLVSHLHVHLVPKYKESAEWGEAFLNAPPSKKMLDPLGYQETIKLIQAKLLR